MLRWVVVVLHRAPDKDWDVGRELIGWGLEGVACAPALSR